MNMEGYVYTDEVIIEITIDGFNGAKGEQGEPGYTPVKGVDYFTEADIAEVVIRTDVEVLAVIQPRLDAINTKLDSVDAKATDAINNLIAEGITRESEDLKLDKKISDVADELGYLDEYVNEGFGAQDRNHVSYVSHQFKDDARKQIARENIDAASVADIQRVESALADKADKSDIPTVDVNKAYVDAGLSTKQDKLVAGDNIIIEGNKISATGGGGTGDVTKEYLEDKYYNKTDVDGMVSGKVDANDNDVEVGALSYFVESVIEGYEFVYDEASFTDGIPKNTGVALFSEENADRDWLLEWSDNGFTTGQSIMLNLNGSPAIYNLKGLYSRNVYRINDGSSNYDTGAIMNNGHDYHWKYWLKKENGVLTLHGETEERGTSWGAFDLTKPFILSNYSNETLWFGGNTDSAGTHFNVCDTHYKYARLKWLNEED